MTNSSLYIDHANCAIDVERRVRHVEANARGCGELLVFRDDYSLAELSRVPSGSRHIRHLESHARRKRMSLKHNFLQRNIFFQAEDGIRDRSPSRGLGDVYKRQTRDNSASEESSRNTGSSPQPRACASTSVSYTHLTLPTICSV